MEEAARRLVPLWAALLVVPLVLVSAQTEVGGIYSQRTRWERARSPYVASSDVLITETGEVEVEPGVVVGVSGPGIGVTVRGGRLVAEGTERDRIVFTTSEEPPRPPAPSLRLVDGPTPWQGRVQILHKDHWRSVCTNSRNWTAPDARVACRQMGLTGGEYSEWYPWLNGTHRLLYERPQCTGTEARVQDCHWDTRAMGAGICDEHADLALRCLPVFDLTRPAAHWRGLSFERADHTKLLTADDTLYQKFSESKLYHVDVLGAGMGLGRQAHAAIESIGVPPRLYGVTVRRSAYGGINITSPDSLVIVNNCTVEENAGKSDGIGVYMNTSTGLARVHDCRIRDNGADGIKFVQHDIQIPRREVDGTPVTDFCSSGTIAQQIFPIYTVAQQFKTSYRPIQCQKRFRARPGLVLTVNFLYLMNERDDDAQLSFYDGTSTSSPLLGTFKVRNATRPQSLVTTRHQLLVTFSALNRTQTEVIMAITAGDGKTHDLNVSSCDVSNNNGRGIAVENLRSLVHVHRTLVANNSHAAGVHVLGGAGDVNITWSQITNNIGTERLGINIEPVANIFGNIEYNYFAEQRVASMRVYSGDTPEVELLPLELNITNNYFERNNGIYVVNIGASQYAHSSAQQILFSRNFLAENDPNSILLSLNEQFVPNFGPDSQNEIGGEIAGQVILPEGTFRVTRDIYVRPGARLTVAFGVRLEFQHSVGMMVAGHIHAEGSSMSEEKRVTFSLEERDQRDNVSLAPVRLVGGRTEREGRLQVLIDNEWGTVCSRGWSILNAALVCRQMGWVLNPLDWQMTRTEMPLEGLDSRVMMSSVSCAPTDLDVTRCRHESAAELEHTCPHEMDVALRCYDVSWAGVRFGLPAEKNILKNVWIESAGLIDHATYTFGPALRMDFNHHVLESVVLTDNDGDGLGIMYSDTFKIDSVNHLKRVEARGNRGHGISLRSLWLDMTNCLVEENGESGIHYNPSLSRHEQRELIGWAGLVRERRVLLPSTSVRIELDLYQPTYLITEGSDEAMERIFHVTTSRENLIGIQVLNPSPPDSSEDIHIYDFYQIEPSAVIWQLRRDFLAFPVSSASYQITLRYMTRGPARGGAVLLFTAIRRSDVRELRPTSLLRYEEERGRVPRLRLHNTLVRKNRYGVSALFYSRYRGDLHELFLRKSNVSIEMYDSELSGNREEAVFYLSPFREDVSHNISEVTTVINRTRIDNNGAGIRQFSRDLWLSNNLFHWVLDNTTVTSNRRGGLDVSLPYVWRYNENFTHSFYVADCTFSGNRDFQAVVGGHFARLQILRNTFQDNICSGGLLAVRGMEKELLISRNVIRRNTGTFMVEVAVDSQSEILGHVTAEITRNEVRFNEQPLSGRAVHAAPSHVLAVRGVQRVNVTENLLGRNQMDYEFLAGTHSSSLATELMASRNWWGTRNPHEIRERIFDFDDWNSYAIARFSPFLSRDSLDAPEEYEYEQEHQPDLDNLGGRIRGNFTLRYRPQPYIVRSDITVMPEATLRLEPGVTLEFYSSVGLPGPGHPSG
ncbi:Protein bark beetle [Amphibalanus amphitrite]|uniref:Protein bark beetle n=1 Tax=Amphibalanus amphitrite TaxID=1232801 RepID=A0A6A4WA60_AMPAM|nr:Protein bark beetle [Amphibalanus amphitrite]